ncbi:unnamed protein product [Discula destructiva]
MSTAEGFTGHAYQPQEEVYFDDGREIALLHFMYNHPKLAEIRGNPQKVLEAIDEYGRTKKYLMNIGEYKSGIVTNLIQEVKPQVMVELGGYCGYSAIAFGAALREAGGQRYYSLEYNPEFGAVISSLVDLAGLRDVVKVEIGASSSSLRRLYADGQLKKIDLLFLDHVKPLYTPDLKLCEELGLIGPGSVLAADNVVKPGNPPYLKYVRSTVEEKRQAYKKEAGLDPDNLPNRQKYQYKTGDGDQVLESDVHGNPNLTYESKFVQGWEPSGVPDAVEVSWCK